MNIKHNLAKGFVRSGFAAALAALFTLTSCNDVVDIPAPADQSNTGAPVITAVYDVADTARTTPITEGTLS